MRTFHKSHVSPIIRSYLRSNLHRFLRLLDKWGPLSQQIDSKEVFWCRRGLKTSGFDVCFYAVKVGHQMIWVQLTSKLTKSTNLTVTFPAGEVYLKNTDMENNSVQKLNDSTWCFWVLPPCSSAAVIHARLSTFFPFQELGAVSLDGYFHLWKAEHNLCKVNQSVEFDCWSLWDPFPLHIEKVTH